MICVVCDITTLLSSYYDLNPFALRLIYNAWLFCYFSAYSYPSNAFDRDCEDWVKRFVVLNDPALNQIEVLIVKNKNGRDCFTHGWLELNNVYQLKHGGSVTLVVVHPNRFVMQIKDRYGEEKSSETQSTVVSKAEAQNVPRTNVFWICDHKIPCSICTWCWQFQIRCSEVYGRQRLGDGNSGVYLPISFETVLVVKLFVIKLGLFSLYQLLFL